MHLFFYFVTLLIMFEEQGILNREHIKKNKSVEIPLQNSTSGSATETITVLEDTTRSSVETKPQCGGERRRHQDTAAKFSGMSLGDIMRVTVMEEMNHLNMSTDKPLDLSVKPRSLAKKNKLF